MPDAETCAECPKVLTGRSMLIATQTIRIPGQRDRSVAIRVCSRRCGSKYSARVMNRR
jgi:hypothetical protein